MVYMILLVPLCFIIIFRFALESIISVLLKSSISLEFVFKLSSFLQFRFTVTCIIYILLSNYALNSISALVATRDPASVAPDRTLAPPRTPDYTYTRTLAHTIVSAFLSLLTVHRPPVPKGRQFTFLLCLLFPLFRQMPSIREF